MYIRKIFLVVAMLSCIESNAQTVPNYISIKTPENTAFNKNIEAPVSMYTGIPSVSIPLYDIEIKGVKIPISLDYHAGGIRVDQEATWVGLGWNLNYGGEISRKVRGVPDEKYFINAGIQSNALSNIDNFRQLPHLTQDPAMALRTQYLSAAKFGNNDFMPDEFYYSIMGYSGKFMFSQEQNKFILFPKEDIAVKYFSQLDPNIPFYYWNLKLPNGTSMDFGKEAKTTSYTDHDNVANSPVTTNSWQIKAIRNTENDSIIYHYQNFNYDSYKFSGQTYTIPSGGSTPTFNSTMTRFYYSDTHPTSINFPNGSISFITSGRADMPTTALSEIDVLNSAGGIVKKVIFNYDYFIGNSYDITSLIGYAGAIPDDYRYKRLKLMSINIESADGTLLKTYKFDYNTLAQMPSKFSFSQDHWGFYNGIPNNTTYGFIPNFAPQFFTGGDRRVDQNYSNVFSLKSVTYPEGGKTEFVYENNTANVNDVPLELLTGFQDNNILDKTAGMNISSYGRMSSYPSPDYVNNGVRYFYHYFTINTPGILSPGYSWSCSTDFGISDSEQNMPTYTNNAKFLLEQLVNGNWQEVKEFNTHPSDGVFNGTDNGQFDGGLSGGEFRLTVALTYAGNQGSVAENQPYNLYFNVNWREINPSTKMVNIGGLRIKDINYRLTDGSLARKKHYDYINPYADATIPTFTSGRAVSFPYYIQLKVQVENFTSGSPGAGPVFYNVISSNSNQPLETTSGSYLGYEYVTETDSDTSNMANNLKKMHHFSFIKPYYSNIYTGLHLGICEPSEWNRGKLLYTQYYKGNMLLKQEDYDYYFVTPPLNSNEGEDYVQEINTDMISYQYLRAYSGCTGEAGPCGYPADFMDNNPGISGTCTYYNYGADDYPYYPIPGYKGAGYCTGDVSLPYFLHYTGFDKPKSKTTTTYDSEQPIIQTENYYYEKTPTLYQMTKVQTNNSKNDTLEQRLKYPSDSLSVSVYNHMVSRHILNPVIVTSNYKNSAFLNSKNTNYQQWADTSIIAPIRNSTVAGTAQPENRVTYLGYDNKGNILSARKPGGANVSYLWGYNQQYPVAYAINASANDIYYDSFEEGNGTASGDAKTGHYSHAGSYTPMLTGLDPGMYTLSYWIKSGGSWSFVVNSNIAVNGMTYMINLNGQIDDVRFYPSVAQMATYTYDPLIGMTSMTDAKGEITYYEYDGLQRLINVKDKDGNIIKHTDYHYQGH